MELRQLRYLEAVIRHRHFSRAADELHVAQSAVSHQVRLLERELGTQLLRRTTRSVEPADAGALVATRAREVLAQLDSLRDELDDLEGLVRGRLAVGAMLFGGRLDIPALLAQFSATYPQVEVAIREGTARRMTELLDAGRLDLAFALEVTSATDDAAPYADLVSGVTFRLHDERATVDRWRRTRAALRDSFVAAEP